MAREYNFEIDSRTKKDLIDTFESVKEVVRKTAGRSRAGLMLGLQELGTFPNGFVGAYYPINSNLIVMNKTPLRRIKETNPHLLEPYSFHVLLHEYIHSLGIIDESIAEKKPMKSAGNTLGKGIWLLNSPRTWGNSCLILSTRFTAGCRNKRRE